MEQQDKALVSMTGEERGEVWDEAYAKEEGTVIEFNPISNSGKILSLYMRLTSESVRIAIELHKGDSQNQFSRYSILSSVQLALDRGIIGYPQMLLSSKLAQGSLSARHADNAVSKP